MAVGHRRDVRASEIGTCCLLRVKSPDAATSVPREQFHRTKRSLMTGFEAVSTIKYTSKTCHSVILKDCLACSREV